MRVQQTYKKYIVLVIILCICMGGCSVNDNTEKYDKIAEQYAQYKFNELIPRICYADTNMVMIYEDHGVLVYNIKDERICGHALLPDNGILQGDGAIAISVSNDGKSVYAITEGGEKMYLWDISKEAFEEIEAVPYEDLIWKPVLFEGDIDQTGSVYPIGSIYTYGEQGYCYLGLEPDENVENIDYSNIRLVVSENDMQKEYVIFK